MTTRAYTLAGALLVVAAALVRLAAAANEFWLGEIWSLRIATETSRARGAHSPSSTTTTTC